MSAVMMDGKALSAKVRQRILAETEALKERGVRPGQVNYLGAVPLVIDKVRQGDTVIAVQYSSTERFSALYGLTTLDLD